jgi:hypothetical protein
MSKSLQTLQSGIDSLSLDEAFAAVKLAKLKMEDLQEQQKSAMLLVNNASKDVKDAEDRLLLSFYNHFTVTLLSPYVTLL